jgi:hypothetical protein
MSRWLTAAVAAGCLALAQCMVVASAVYLDTQAVPSNQFGTAATYPTYPAAVTEDAPLFYHRLDDTTGSSTAADSSGNGLTGVYTPGTASTGVAMVMPLDENADTTARDLSGRVPAHNATLANGAAWTSAGRFNSAVAFDGTNDYLATGGPVVNTAASFSVSAWVYLTAAVNYHTVAAQASGTGPASAFILQYRPEVNRWGFLLPRFDSTAPTSPIDLIYSTGPPALNTWTHLLGVFDAAAGQMRLYVNGVAQGGPVAHTTTWNATGAVIVGAAWWGAGFGFWPGRIDEVRIYSGAVTPAGAAELASGVTAGPTMAWDFDENAGASTQDVSGDTNPGALAGGAGWTTGQSGSAVALNGTNQSVESGRPAVHTDQSFTVAAWVYLTDASTYRVAVAQDGGSASGFYLEYHAALNRWVFLIFSADNVSAPFGQAVSTGAPTLNTWTHLVGVYDDAADQLRLFVNGVAGGTGSLTADWDATGPTTVGRGLYSGAPVSYFAGAIDRVRLYQRAVTASEVTAVYGGSTLGSVTVDLPGALVGSESGSTAAAFSTAARDGYNPTRYTNPTTFTIECWFRSSGPAPGSNPGTLLGFGSTPSGDSASHDRRVYVDPAGNVVFGSASGVTGTVQSSGVDYLDGAWHHLAAVLDPTAGMALYLDGELVDSGPYVAPGSFTGYWRWGGDGSDVAWPSDYFLGTIDEVAVYPAALLRSRIAAHYHANH